MFNKVRSLRIMHGGQNRYQNIPYNYTDVDGLYTMFDNTDRVLPIYDSYDSYDDIEESKNNIARSILKLITFSIGLLYVSLALILLECGILHMMLLYSIPILWGYLSFQTGISKMILRYSTNRRILGENSKLFLVDNMNLDSVHTSEVDMGNGRILSHDWVYHIVKKIPPLILGVCLGGYLGPFLIPFLTNSLSLDLIMGLISACLKVSILFSLSWLFMSMTFSTILLNDLILGERIIPMPQFILTGHSCVYNPGGLDLRSYLLMARSLWLGRNNECLESYPSVFPKEDENPALGEILVPNNVIGHNRFVGRMHFNTEVLSEILNLNDRYLEHFNEMGRRMGIDKDDCIFYSSEDILDSLELGLSIDNLMDILEDDMMKIHILLDILEFNGRNYHRRGNELFVMLCGDLGSKDFHPVTWDFYEDHAEGEISKPYFLPEYPDKGREVNFCIDTMMPYQGARGSVIADNNGKDED